MSGINYIEELPEGTFPINLKWIQKYQRLEPSIIAKYRNCRYHRGYVCGGINVDLKFITCEDNIVISSKLKSYVVHWYHMYLLHLGMDITEVMIRQHLY